tara:strand:- start:26248 stop:26565 length:318 start_codon:yes stop_codon:yes gene_type:complete
MSKDKDFFNRKKKKVKEELIFGEYDPSNFDNDLNACGITDIDGFKRRHDELFNNLIVDSSKANPVVTLAQRIEDTFSTREIVFLMSKDVLQAAYNESLKQLKEKK